MRRYSAVIPENDSWTFSVKGNYVFLRTSAVAVQVLARENSEQAELSQGDSAEFSPFTEITVINPTASALTIVIMVATDKRVQSAQVGGNMTSSPGSGSFTQGRSSVSNTAVNVIAANTARKMLLVQNNSSIAVMRITVNGTAATATTGFRLQPGESITFEGGYIPTAAVSCIMETADATANNVEWVHG